MIAAKGANILITTLLVGAVDGLNVTWGDCCGSVGIGSKHPIVKGKIKQCETILFNSGGMCRLSCPDVFHDLFLFPDLAAYVTFDTSSIEQLANGTKKTFGSIEFSDPGFTVEGGVETGIAYYGNHGGDHNDDDLGRKKIAIKTVPDFVERYVGYRCSGGGMSFMKQFVGQRKEKRCRALCKKTEGCIAYEFSYRTRRWKARIKRKVNRCRIYLAFLPSVYPDKGASSRQYTCTIARKKCDDEKVAPGV